MLLDKSIKELSDSLSQKKISCEDLVNECFVNIEKYAKKTNAFITLIDREKARLEAKEKDKNISTKKSSLYGIPYVLKDAYVTKGIRTTSASNVLKNYIPQYNATVYQKLLDAGAILVG